MQTRNLCLGFLFSLSFSAAFAQDGKLSGSVESKEHEALFGAAIVLRKLPDSSLLTQTVSDMTGAFNFEKLPRETLLLEVSMLGNQTKYRNIDLKTQAEVQLGRLVLDEDVQLLDVVEIDGVIPPLVIKGDTSEYNAAAYKTNPDATVEDLVRKMPGITTQDGKIQAQGEEVKRVTVDGRDFFGDDASAVMKNLPAEIVDKIQVFDRASDESQFTGFDDGNTSKAINIVTKTEFRNGSFGRAFAGYGYEDRWKAGGVFNNFDENRRFTLLLNSNNINEQNFAMEDLVGVMSGGGGRGGGGGPRGPSESFLVNTNAGIATTHALGLNYSENFGKKLKLSGSYFLNYSNTLSESDLVRSYINPESASLSYLSKEDNQSKNLNHRFQARMEWQIDSNNNLMFNPRVSVQQNTGYSDALVQSGNLDFQSLSRYLYDTDLTGLSLGGTLLFRHKFAKPRRTLTLGITPSYSATDGNSLLQALNSQAVDPDILDSLEQIGALDRQGLTLNAMVDYTEPVGKSAMLGLSYRHNLNFNNADQQTESDGLLDPSLSNTFDSRYQTQSVELSLRNRTKKLRYGIQLAAQRAELINERVYPSEAYFSRTFYSILPSLHLNYKVDKSQTLRINYRSRNQSPSIDQLQDVLTVSNPLAITSGNADLKQDFQNIVSLRYNKVNVAKNQSFFIMLNGNYTHNYIGKSTYLASQDTLLNGSVALGLGGQYTRPVNLAGYFYAKTFSAYSFYLTPFKSNLSFNGGLSYTRSPGQINEQNNFANTVNGGLGLTLSSNISENLDFTFSSNSTYNYLKNSLQDENDTRYFNQDLRFGIQAMPIGGLVLQSEVQYRYYNGLSNALGSNYTLWNAGIGYKFLKGRRAEIRLTAFDLLGMNTSLNRNVTETYYEDVQNMVLQRYFMLNFSYRFQTFKGKAEMPEDKDERGPRGEGEWRGPRPQGGMGEPGPPGPPPF